MPDPATLNLQHAPTAVDVLTRAAGANLDSPLRRGSVVDLRAPGRVLMSGDLHDHAVNFQRLVKLAALDKDPSHHLVLHELIHGPNRVNNRDLSIRLLLRGAALKLAYPGQVHFLLSNHELAQVRGEDILKEGGSVVGAFDDGVDFIYGDDADAVRAALDRFVRSLPLAVRTPNGILLCHSLPAASRIAAFDPGILDRVATEADLSPGGSAHLMVWGRSHPESLAQRLAAAWNVRLFVMGHQPVDMGHEPQGESMLIIASDHDHGMALPIDLSRNYTIDALIDSLIPLAGVVL